MNCATAGCAGKHFGKGLCEKHYRSMVYRVKHRPKEKGCIVCGKTFQPFSRTTLTCSTPCGQERNYQKARARADKMRKKRKDDDRNREGIGRWTQYMEDNPSYFTLMSGKLATMDVIRAYHKRYL